MDSVVGGKFGKKLTLIDKQVRQILGYKLGAKKGAQWDVKVA